DHVPSRTLPLRLARLDPAPLGHPPPHARDPAHRRSRRIPRRPRRRTQDGRQPRCRLGRRRRRHHRRPRRHPPPPLDHGHRPPPGCNPRRIPRRPRRRTHQTAPHGRGHESRRRRCTRPRRRHHGQTRRRPPRLALPRPRTRPTVVLNPASPRAHTFAT